MKRLADHIQKIPPEKRDKFIWISAGAVVVIMLIVWIIVGNGRRPKAERSLFDLVKQQFNESKNQYKDFQK